MLDADPHLLATHPEPTLMADKNYYGSQFEATLADAGIELLRPARKGEKPRAGQRFFKPLRQVIESVNNTLKTQLDLERHGGRTIAGVAARVLQRILALTAAIWHNDRTDQPILRSLTALRPLTLGITHLVVSPRKHTEMELPEMNSKKLRLASATIGASALVGMGALTVALSSDNDTGTYCLRPRDHALGETTTSSTAPAEPETTLAVPEVTAEPPQMGSDLSRSQRGSVPVRWPVSDAG